MCRHCVRVGETDEPPVSGHLIIIDPFLPEDQCQREIRAVAPVPGTESAWTFEASEPLGWNGVMTTGLAMKPRGAATKTWLDIVDGKLFLNGCLYPDDPDAPYCGFIGQYMPDGP